MCIRDRSKVGNFSVNCCPSLVRSGRSGSGRGGSALLGHLEDDDLDDLEDELDFRHQHDTTSVQCTLLLTKISFHQIDKSYVSITLPSRFCPLVSHFEYAAGSGSVHGKGDLSRRCDVRLGKFSAVATSRSAILAVLAEFLFLSTADCYFALV